MKNNHPKTRSRADVGCRAWLDHTAFLKGKQTVLKEKHRAMVLINRWVNTLPVKDQECIYSLLCI